MTRDKSRQRGGINGDTPRWIWLAAVALVAVISFVEIVISVFIFIFT